MSLGYEPVWLVAELRRAAVPKQLQLWGSMVFRPYRFPPTRELVDLAIAEVARWAVIPSDEVDRNRTWALGGMRALFATVSCEKPALGPRIAESLAPFCAAQNLDVSAHMIRFFEEHAALVRPAVPFLRQVALGEVRRPPASELGLRGLAFKVLVDVAPDAARDLDEARATAVAEYLQIALARLQQGGPYSYEDLCMIANRLMWT